jgi:hypothetical protein
MQLVLVTQYFDTLKSIGENDKTSTLFLAHTPGAVKEVSDQILESMLVAGKANQYACLAPNCFSLLATSAALPGVDCFGAQPDALFQVAGEPRGHQRRRRVQQHNVAPRAGNAGQNVIEHRRIGLHIAADELVQRGARQPGHLWRDAGGLQLGLRPSPTPQRAPPPTRRSWSARRCRLSHAPQKLAWPPAPPACGPPAARGWAPARRSPESAPRPGWSAVRKD